MYLIALSCKRKPIKFCSSEEDFVAVASINSLVMMEQIQKYQMDDSCTYNNTALGMHREH